MANKLAMASERRKLALRAMVLNNRQRVAQLQEQTKRAREELKSMSPRRGGNSGVAAAALPKIRLGRVA